MHAIGVWLMGVVMLSSQEGDTVTALETKGKVDEVTVYRGQALLTRLVDLPGPAGFREIVVTELPQHVVPGSLYAESADGVEVRSVRYRVRPVSEDVREEVRKLDEQIRTVEDEIRANQRGIEVLAEHKAYLAKLEQFVAPTATAELSKGILDAETLKALTLFLLEQRRAAAEQELKLGIEQRELQAKQSLLRREHDVLSSGSARTLREAVVFVNVQQASGGRLRLRYLVEQANWSPSYNVRADADRQKVVVEYNAAIEQMSGEDWTDVAMTLSTATPSLLAKAPMLAPLTVALAAPSESPVGGREELVQRQRQEEQNRALSNVLQYQQQAMQQQQPRAQPSEQAMPSLNPDLSLNMLAGEIQVVDLVSKGQVGRASKKGAQPSQESLSVTYALPNRTSLPSRSDRQLIQIAARPMAAKFYKVATPVLTSYVYEEASVVNEGAMVLLAGPVATSVAGQFVGHGQIPTVTTGEEFTVGLGIDSALRAGRELVERNETIQGGNRVVDFTYRLTLENFAGQATQVRLFDRLPTGKKSELTVSQLATKYDLSKEEAYEQGERKKGILRWDLEVPAQVSGLQALGVEYQFRLEYDKQMTLAGMPGERK